MSLADRIHNLFAASQDFQIDTAAIDFASDRRVRTDHEHDLIGWGVFYGVTFGVARTEDPLEPNEAVAERAIAAATEAWARWGSIDPRDEFDWVEVEIAGEHHAAVRDVMKIDIDTFETNPSFTPLEPGRADDLRDEFNAIVTEYNELDWHRTGGQTCTILMRRNRVREIGTHLLNSGVEWEHADPKWGVEVDHAAGRALLDQVEAMSS